MHIRMVLGVYPYTNYLQYHEKNRASRTPAARDVAFMGLGSKSLVARGRFGAMYERVGSLVDFKK